MTDIYSARSLTGTDQTNAFIQTMNRNNYSYDGRPSCLSFDTRVLADRHRADSLNHYRNNVGANITGVGFGGV